MARTWGTERPMNARMDSSTVQGKPYSVRRRASTVLATGSLSTRTPSLSKITRSKAPMAASDGGNPVRWLLAARGPLASRPWRSAPSGGVAAATSPKGIGGVFRDPPGELFPPLLGRLGEPLAPGRGHHVEVLDARRPE